jgi:hypothetical protein
MGITVTPEQIPGIEALDQPSSTEGHLFEPAGLDFMGFLYGLITGGEKEIEELAQLEAEDIVRTFTNEEEQEVKETRQGVAAEVINAMLYEDNKEGAESLQERFSLKASDTAEIRDGKKIDVNQKNEEIVADGIAVGGVKFINKVVKGQAELGLNEAAAKRPAFLAEILEKNKSRKQELDTMADKVANNVQSMVQKFVKEDLSTENIEALENTSSATMTDDKENNPAQHNNSKTFADKHSGSKGGGGRE